MDDIIQAPNSSVMITPFRRSSKTTLSCKKRGRDCETPKDDEVLPWAQLIDWGSKVRLQCAVFPPLSLFQTVSLCYIPTSKRTDNSIKFNLGKYQDTTERPKEMRE